MTPTDSHARMSFEARSVALFAALTLSASAMASLPDPTNRSRGDAAKATAAAVSPGKTSPLMPSSTNVPRR